MVKDALAGVEIGRSVFNVRHVGVDVGVMLSCLLKGRFVSRSISDNKTCGCSL